ncbi:MAG: AAA family ATPase [Clostridiales bacterium]|nr:AAA family ATPase [Clostridiales bacterium]
MAIDKQHVKDLWNKGNETEAQQLIDDIKDVAKVFFTSSEWSGIFTNSSKINKGVKDKLVKFIRNDSKVIFGSGEYAVRKNDSIEDDALRKSLSDNIDEVKSDYFYNKILFLRTVDIDNTCKLEKHFICISKEDVLNSLYKKFCDENILDAELKNKTWANKSSAICEKCYDILNEGKTKGEEGFVDKSFENDIKIYKYIIEPLTYGANPVLANDFDLFPNIILYGAPGTGKTFHVENALQMLAKDPNRYKKVQFHPGFGYEEFIEGLKPVGINDATGALEFEVVNGVFKDLCIEANKHPEEDYFFVADEINRANLSAVFGETLSLLEKDYRVQDITDVKNMRQTPLSQLIKAEIEKADDKKSQEIKEKQFYCDDNKEVYFGIPKNVYFIGMMNDVDKSIDSFDLALRRRFKWVRMDCDYDVVRNKLRSDGVGNSYVERYINSCKRLNGFISGDTELYKSNNKQASLGFGKAYEFGHAYYLKIGKKGDAIYRKQYSNFFDNHIAPVLSEYIRSFVEEKRVDQKIKDAKCVFTQYAPEVIDNSSFEAQMKKQWENVGIASDCTALTTKCQKINNTINSKHGPAYRLSPKAFVDLFTKDENDKKGLIDKGSLPGSKVEKEFINNEDNQKNKLKVLFEIPLNIWE